MNRLTLKVVPIWNDEFNSSKGLGDEVGPGGLAVIHQLFAVSDWSPCDMGSMKHMFAPTFTLKFKLDVRKTTIHGFYGYWFMSKVYLIDNQRQKLTYIIDIHPAVASKAPNLGQVQIWVSLDVGIRNKMSKNVVGLGWYQWSPIVTIVSKTMEIYPNFGSHHDFPRNLSKHLAPGVWSSMGSHCAMPGGGVWWMTPGGLSFRA